jgi:hypothetical protein
MKGETKSNIWHWVQGILLMGCLALVVVIGLTLGGVIDRGEPEPEEPAFDPVAAYCRGLSDGWVHAREANRGPLEAAGIPIITDTPEQITEFEALCAETVLTGDLRDYLQGPLFMPEDES